MSFPLAPSLAAFALAFALAAPALADVPPPDSAQCADLAEGTACVTDAKTNGTCQKDTCQKLDYSNGTPPSTISYDCMLCKVSSGNTSGSGASGSGASGGSAGSTSSSGCSIVAGHAGTAGALLALLGIPLLLRRRRS